MHVINFSLSFTDFLSINQEDFCAFVTVTVYLKTAFDRVIVKKILGMLPGHCVYRQVQQAVKSHYIDNSARVRIGVGIFSQLDIRLGNK